MPVAACQFIGFGLDRLCAVIERRLGLLERIHGLIRALQGGCDFGNVVLSANYSGVRARDLAANVRLIQIAGRGRIQIFQWRLGYRNRCRRPAGGPAEPAEFGCRGELVVQLQQVIAAKLARPIEFSGGIAGTVLRSLDPRMRIRDLFGEFRYQFAQWFELLTVLVSLRLLKRCDFAPQPLDSLLDFVDFPIESLQHRSSGLRGLPLTKFITRAVAQFGQPILSGFGSLPQVVYAIGTVIAEQTCHGFAGLFECSDVAAMLLQVLQWLSRLGQGLVG